MHARIREVSALELALWHRAVRDVVRLIESEHPGQRQTPPTPEPASPLIESTPAPRERPRPTAGRPSSPPRPTPLDRRTLRALERGRYPITARLDLHGMTQESAHAALESFFARAQAQGHRCVLVITGRGERKGGVLREAVPRWLAAPPLAEHVLSWAEAAPRHGGAGALYVLLRRKR